MQNSGHVDDDIQISVLDVFYAMDGRRTRFIKDVLDCHREEDAGHLRRNELNERVENMTARNSLEVKIWQNETSWKSENRNKNIAMTEEFEKNFVMNENIVKNIVMKAKINPKVVMDLLFFKIGGWNSLQASSIQSLDQLWYLFLSTFTGAHSA